MTPVLKRTERALIVMLGSQPVSSTVREVGEFSGACGSPPRSPATMDDIQQTFAQYDKDGNGSISYEEAHQVLREELGFDEDKTRKLIKVYDRNGDGRLSYDEFIWFYWKIKEKRNKLERIFKKIDTDGSQTISYDEAKEALRDFSFSDHEIETLVRLHDQNEDGCLQYEEFVHFWNDCGGKRSRKK